MGLKNINMWKQTNLSDKMGEIRYRSTNRSSGLVDFHNALLSGQAPDGGLFTPDKIPRLDTREISALRGLPYHEVAFRVMNKFLEGDLPQKELRRITTESYNFQVPIESFSGNRYVMRLDQGPTASFKDFAARSLSRLMEYYIGLTGEDLTLLGATSGDTGSAMGSAFHNIKRTRVIILFPKDEVTLKQRKQMTTLGDNITAYAVNGKFDDCQSMVTQAFSDQDLKALNLSSVNSINIGRLLPQTVYYFYAHSQIQSESIGFSVPSGNFGNLTSGLMAKMMGLPAERFVCAVNENDEFPIFLETGHYRKIDHSYQCISNAMNVGNPSNLRRIFNFYGGQIDGNGTVLSIPELESMRQDIFSTSVSDEATKFTMKVAYKTDKLLLEPHGAVAWAGLKEYLRKHETKAPYVALETAHPAKFPEVISETINVIPEEPEGLKNLEGKPESFGTLSTDYGEFKQLLIDRLR